MGDIIEFASFGALKQEVEQLRIELSMIVLEKDTLERIECKNIEMSYVLTFSAHIHKVQELQTKSYRLKRELELMQTSINRQEKINIKQIHQQLDEEMIEYEAKLNEFVDQVNEALYRFDHLVEIDSKDNAMIKKLYRKIVRGLHPDLNPDVSQEQINLYMTAIHYYETGNLNGLKLIAEMVNEGLNIDENSIDAFSMLQEQKNHLLHLIDETKQSVEKIKSSLPYILSAFIETDEAIQKKKDELSELAEQYQQAINHYQMKINHLREKHKQ